MLAETTWSGGHAGEVPKHTSARSQAPAEVRHSTPDKKAGGQSALLPVQVSGASQMSLTAALQTWLAG
jgi:hypothetical protein